jgi:hypothetical protein
VALAERSCMAPKGGERGGGRACAPPRSPGLVSYSTSGTHTGSVDQSGIWLRLDPVRSRLRRMRASVLCSSDRLEVDSLRGGVRLRRLFLTLTYRPSEADSSGDISAFRDRMRQWFKRRGAVCRFVWVREAHKSGRPHFHVLVWLPRSLRLPAADACGWWPHGMTNTQVVHSGAAYLAKYLSKVSSLPSAAFPKGCRIHGSGGLSARSRWDRRWFLSPRWVRESLGAGADPVRVRGGWSDRFSGFFVRSPWSLVKGGGGSFWVCRPFQLGESCNASSSQVTFA